jgi:hypothetical protein
MLATYFVMTYSAFGPKGAPVLAFASTRYALPGLLLGAVATAWAGTALARVWQVPVAGLLALVAVLGLRTQYRPDVPLWQILAASVVVAGAIGVSRLLPRALVATGLLVLVVIGAGLTANRLNGRTYASTDPVLGWIDAHAASGHRIGLAGIWGVSGVSPVLPAFGPRLGNQVEYAGPFVKHMLRRYTSREAFLARLRTARYDLLVVGRGQGIPPEERWARAAGWLPVVGSPRLALLRRPAPGRAAA